MLTTASKLLGRAGVIVSILLALSKVGLIELDPAERKRLEKAKSTKKSDVSMADIDKLLEQEGIDPKAGAVSKTSKKGKAQAAPAKSSPAASKKKSPAKSKPPGNEKISKRPFQEIYSAAKIEASVYSAEKMLKLIDGLSSMDGSTRKTAIMAMDAADDAWTIADPVMDAKRKISALGAHQSALDGQVAQLQKQTEQEVQKLDAFSAEAEKSINAQVAKLLEQLKSELEKVSAQKEALRLRLAQNTAVALEEQSRLTSEIQRLENLPKTFASVLQSADKAGTN